MKREKEEENKREGWKGSERRMRGRGGEEEGWRRGGVEKRGLARRRGRVLSLDRAG